MKITPTYGPTRNQRTHVTALVCAALVVIMLVSQLFSYEHFPATLDVLLPINDQPLIHLSAALIVLGELLALPYLLGMRLSKLMRAVSAGLAILVAVFWLLMSLTNAHVGNSGLFSTTFDLPGGILPVLWSLAVFGTLAYVLTADSKFRHASSTYTS